MTTSLRDQLQSSLGAAYTLERELGGGGMSRVFVATDPSLGRQVVVKVLSPELAQGISAERFAREIKVAAALQDPHIVPVHSAGTTAEGLPYYTMPFVEGQSLRARMQQGAVPLDESLRILRDVAEALEYAHAHGVVHRDIKPENVLLAGRNAVVADFGIAKAVSAARTDAPGATLTQLGQSLGTPAYMAPEQAAGDPTDHRADIYAWGVMAYELLAGAHPFAHKTTTQQLIAAHIAETPKPLDDVRPGLPPSLGALVMRTLGKDPAQRPGDAGGLLASLGSVATSGAYVPLAVAKPSVARRAILAGIAIVALVGVALGARYFGRPHAQAIDATPSLAVLPFEHQGDSSDAYLTDGITDEIRGKLTGVHDLVVIARGSSNQYRATKKSPADVAKELGVRYLMTGTVRVLGTGTERRVLVRPELVEITTDGKPQSRWQAPFESDLKDVLKMQAGIAGQVVDAMQVAVGGEDRARLDAVAVRDPQAYDAYLRAQAAIGWGAQVDPVSLRVAIGELRQSIARDSTMPEAWSTLAFAQSSLYATYPSRALGDSVRRAAERARSLDANGADGHAAMFAYLRNVNNDGRGSLAEAVAAQRAAPGDAEHVSRLAGSFESMGRWDDALRYRDLALRLDPRNVAAQRGKAVLLARMGRHADARLAIDRAWSLAPTLTTMGKRVQTALAAGDLARARAAWSEARDIPLAARAEYLSNVGLVFIADSAGVNELMTLGPEAFGGDRGDRALNRARVFYLRGDSAAVHAYADSAVRYYRQIAEDAASSDIFHATMAMALAYAGRRDEAIAEARRGIEIGRAGSASPDDSWVHDDLYYGAQAAAAAGDHATAMQWLEELVAHRAGFTPARMRLDPFLVALRGDPRFERLVAGGVQ